MSYPDQEHKIVSVPLRDGFLEVVRRYQSTFRFGSGSLEPDRIVKEIYASSEPIVLDRVIEGTHTPAFLVSEKIDFPLDE